MDSTKYPHRLDKCVHCGKPGTTHKSTAPLAGMACPEHGIIARLKRRAAEGDFDGARRFELTHNIDIAYARACGGQCADCGATPEECFTVECQKAYCPACLEYERLKVEIGCLEFVAESASYPIRALVRHVAMRRCGHFMIGSVRIHGNSLMLSGSYGSDGLPDSVPDEVYGIGVELPRDLVGKWNRGGGWNGAGDEAGEMRAWALENLKDLRR